MMQYTVTVTDWTQPRGYRGSGRGWRVRCFGLREDGWNDLGHTVHETFHRTKAAAERQAKALAASYGANWNQS
jgi:hypothetical protein